MDRFDTAILSALQADGRMTWSELATRVNLNEAALGHAVKAFVTVHVERQDTGLAEEFRRRVREHPQVQACHMISGSIDFILEVVASDLDAFAQFIDSDLLGMPAVKDASSSIVLKVVKPRQTMIS
jgi:Lrp/AsnC family leucine-responsive transcriptional regulator